MTNEEIDVYVNSVRTCYPDKLSLAESSIVRLLGEIAKRLPEPRRILLDGFEETHVPGRGRIFYGCIPLDDSLPKINEHVQINGVIYSVVGLELSSGTHGRNSNVGILVKDIA